MPLPVFASSGCLIGSVASPLTPIAWYDASQLTGLSDGATVTTFPDVNGVYDATGGSALYKTNQINSLPVVRTNGSNYFSASTSTNLDATSGLTILCVCRIPSSGAGKGVAGKYNGNGWYLITKDTTTASFGTNDGATQSGVIHDNVTRIIGGDIDQSGSKTVAQIINGVVVQSISPATVRAVATSALTIGSYASNSGVSVAADIGEIKIYNSRLTDAQINTVGSAMATKWGVTWTGI